jgi:hypothetical protein
MAQSWLANVPKQVACPRRGKLVPHTKRLVDRKPLVRSILTLLASEADIALSYLRSARAGISADNVSQVQKWINKAEAIYAFAITYLADLDGNFNAEQCELQSTLADLLELMCSTTGLADRQILEVSVLTGEEKGRLR